MLYRSPHSTLDPVLSALSGGIKLVVIDGVLHLSALNGGIKLVVIEGVVAEMGADHCSYLALQTLSSECHCSLMVSSSCMLASNSSVRLVHVWVPG